jgi:hypothetical protein
MRDAFGRLIADPATLDRRQRVDLLRRLSGALQASDDLGATWLGRTLATWLHDGGDLAAALGLRPPRGSRATAQRQVQIEQRDRLALRLSASVGGDRAALRVLQGMAPCPGSVSTVVAELRTLGAPTSAAGFTRARQRVSHHQ